MVLGTTQGEKNKEELLRTRLGCRFLPAIRLEGDRFGEERTDEKVPL